MEVASGMHKRDSDDHEILSVELHTSHELNLRLAVTKVEQGCWWESWVVEDHVRELAGSCEGRV